ncbi:MAG TPA: tripartite tricarboxylate transporter substrate binding protein [Burkholderiaceae bacterium]|nr:tripartite tricarboxylate transporter substrate binding protein [Burkholderiaceae bacterium]
MWKQLRSAVIALAAVLMCAPSTAQEYPVRPVRLIVPYAPGGSPDVFARVIGTRLSEALGQPFVVENRAGAGGIAAAEHVAKSDPDGYTLLVPDVAQLAVNPALFAKIPYDPVKDFAPISLIGSIPLFIVVRPSLQVNSVPELVKLAKSKPGQLSYGTGGIGSLAHILMESFKRPLGLDILHVPFKGSGASTPAFLAGHVDMLMTAFAAVGPHVTAGNVKVLAVSSATRSPAAPDVPSISEFIPGYDFTAEIGLLAPAGTPAHIVNKLAAEVAKAVKHPDTIQRFSTIGALPMSTTPEAYAENIKRQLPRFDKAVKESGAKATN